jgi:DNA polymerase
LAYATAFGVDPNTVTKEQRTIGKPIELGLGFGGGTGALITFAALYRIDIDDMALKAREAADMSLWHECESSYEWYLEKKLTNDLPNFTWTGCQYYVKAWRNRRHQTDESWKTCETAFENAMLHPGIHFEMANRTYAYGVANAGGVWVFVQLPSGRSLVYPQVHYSDRGGRKQLAYMGVNPFTRKWGAVFTYSGRLSENITQAVARDVLFWSLPQVEAAGYSVVTRIHDELLTEVPVNSGLSADRLAQIMSQPHSWCPDLPLNAVGETLTRYQK